MMAFNFFSHGSQDLYPSQFLGARHHLSTGQISVISMIVNIGAIVGGIGIVAVLVALLVTLGREPMGMRMGTELA